jgi:hypothetical protein
MPTILESPLPLSVHLASPANRGKDLILYNGLKLGRITDFDLLLSTESVITTFHVAGCFPIPGPAPDDANSNSIYPLRIRLGTSPHETMVTLCSRPISGIISLQMRLAADEPRHVFMSFADKKFAPLELLEALEELGIIFEVH